MKPTVILFCICVSVKALELTVEKIDIEYHNPEYFNALNLTMRKLGRNKPYVINLYADCKVPMGNNLTIKWSVYEIIGGHHLLTPIIFEYGLCDFLYNEPYSGKMLTSQFKENLTCPFPVGLYKFENLEYNLKFPYVPFTFSSLYVRIFTLIEAYMHNVHLALRWKFYFALKQKLQDKNRKN